MKKLTVFLSLCFISLMVFAQDSTGGGAVPDVAFPAWVYTAGAIILAVYEILIRFFPTAKNYSILGFVITLIQKLIPNKSSTSNKLP